MMPDKKRKILVVDEGTSVLHTLQAVFSGDGRTVVALEERGPVQQWIH
jgi:hypothetical protein